MTSDYLRKLADNPTLCGEGMADQLREAADEIDILKENIRLTKRVDELTAALRRARNAHPGFLDCHWNSLYQYLDEVLGDEHSS